MSFSPRALLCSVALCLSWTAGAAAASLEPVDCINPLSGTNGNTEFSRGNTVPAIVAPFGLTTWAPQTNGNGGLFYELKDTDFEGIRATHQPSVWIRDYGDFVLMPVVGDWKGSPRSRASKFSHVKEISRAYYYSVSLDRYNTQLELTPTERCAFVRLSYLTTPTATLVFATEGDFDTDFDPSHHKLRGTARHVTFGAPGNFAMYFVAEFDRPFASADSERKGKQVTGAVQFADVKADQPVNVRLGCSFISYEQAEQNLRAELPDWNFDAARDRAKSQWAHELATVEISGATDAQRTTFYTALYRALQFPRSLAEPDASGKPRHYSPFDNGKIHDGPLYTDDGVWDTFRAAFPFYILYYPQRSADILNGWLNAYHEGGRLPEWPSPGNRPCMIGSHADSILADACVKKLPGVDFQDAYAAARKDALENDRNGFAGRDHLDEYLEKGYIAADSRKDASVSCTLEYAYDDFCVSRLAAALGKTEEAEQFARRAINYRNVWNAESGFMSPRLSDGSWQKPFEPLAWGGAFTEGNAWQWLWSVMQDPYGLMTLLGGTENTAKKLDELLALPSKSNVGGYGHLIHEMRETEASNMGQYSHVNEPCHHVLYFYNYARQPWKTQLAVRRVLDELYDTNGMLGDEDTGQMSAWYVFNATGFYPFCPGSPYYLIGGPLFPETTIHLPEGKTFTVRAKNNSPENRYIQAAKLNGEPFTKTWLAHATIVAGGVLEFEMGPQPNKNWGANEADAPPNHFPLTSTTISTR